MAVAVKLDGDVAISPSTIIRSSNDEDYSQMQARPTKLSVAPGPSSTPFSASIAQSKTSVKTSCVLQSLPPIPTHGRVRAISTSSTRSYPRSILVSTEPVLQVAPPLPAATGIVSREASTDSGSSPSSSESELQTPATDDGSHTTLASCSSSCVEANSSASPIRTRATTLSSANTSLCVTFAPLPEIGPRQRKSSRPIGLAARGQILRQRRMMMTQGNVSYYYDDGSDPVSGGQKTGRRVKDESNKTRRDDLEDTEIAIATLGKMLGDATKTLWNRVAQSRPRDGDDSSLCGPKTLNKRPPKSARGFTWPGRGRRRLQNQKASHDLDGESESDADEPWSRRRDEDPTTKTIMEGSDDELEEFVLACDELPECEEEAEQLASAHADEEIRTTVEVHLVKVAEGESDD